MRFLVGVLTIALTNGLEAQTVRGQVTDSVSRTPLAGAFLTLVDSSGSERARAITDVAGQFTLTAPEPGTYRLRSKRIGFRPYFSPALALHSGETMWYSAAIDPIPIALREVVVAGERQCAIARCRTWRGRSGSISKRASYATSSSTTHGCRNS